MRLKLNQEHDVAILEVLEDVSAQNVSVLRAGITKLLQSGKNKIVLNLVNATRIGSDVVRDIIKLHIVASELRGEIVLVGQGEMVKQAINSFATAPLIKYFSTREAAIRYFVAAAGLVQAPIPTFENVPNANLKTRIARLDVENKSLKGHMSTRDPDELRRLRFENSVFQQQLTAMEEQLRILVKERKQAFEMESLQTKVLQLENALSNFLRKENLLPQKE